MPNRLTTIALSAALVLGAVPALARTLDSVREAGFLRCGVTEGVPGFSDLDADGSWIGLEVDYCRALAAAIFDDPSAVRYVPLGPGGRDNLRSGEIDILARTMTWTMSGDTEAGVTFVGAMFYDGQSFIVRADGDIGSAIELDGRSVCVEAGTPAESNAADFFASTNMRIETVALDSAEAVGAAYLRGECDTYTKDASAMAAERSGFPDPSAHVILPEIISKEPLGPVVRSDDSRWLDIARWTYFALINAEELGLTSANVDDLLGSENPEIRRFLGVEGDFGTPMGLTADWAYRIVKHVGSYSEIYERHVGESTPLAIPRGINALWTQGGIQYAPPIR